MSNDITALMATMKAAAEKATPGEWRVFSHPASGTYAVHTPKDKRCEDVIKWPGFDGQQNAAGNAEFIAAASPANVKALVEALEARDKQIAELKSKLSNPVKLPKTNGYWTEQEKAYEEAITLAKRQIRLAGFRVIEGDA
ncbi:ead/Ea22-like family protein [Kluyvera sichuanensis]